MTKLIINVGSGEVVERELNKAEKDQQKIDETQIATEETLKKAEAQAKANTKAALLNKLGISAEEATLLLS
jgi:hypothetical protein